MRGNNTVHEQCHKREKKTQINLLGIFFPFHSDTSFHGAALLPEAYLDKHAAQMLMGTPVMSDW